VVVLAVVGPIIFFKFTEFITRVFLKDGGVWGKWRFILRLNLMVVITVYLLVAAGIGKVVITFIYGPFDDNRILAQQVVAADIDDRLNQDSNIEPGTTLDSKPIPPNEQNNPQKESAAPNSISIKTVGKTVKHDVSPVRIEDKRVQVDGYIHLGNQRRFGVNWKSVPGGLKIVRLSPGPMKRAGFKKGDVIVSLNGMPISGEKKLMALRNDIVRKNASPVTLSVTRGREEFKFLLLK